MIIGIFTNYDHTIYVAFNTFGESEQAPNQASSSTSTTSTSKS